jgi:metal-responsive CopG/Arc/MetJ family transcriptional regulator
MDSETSSPAKIKITASLDTELVKAIDAYLTQSNIRSRSRLIENVLHNWYQQQKKREIENQTEKYYLSLSDEERKEDRAWTEIAAKSTKHLWEE